MRIIYCLAFVAVIGCTNGGKGPETGGGGDMAMGGGSGTGGGDLGGNDMTVVTRSVHATGNITFVSDGQDVARPRDFSQTTVAALVAPAGGAFTIYPATAANAGAVTIDDVPAGRYYLRLGDNYVLHDPGDVTVNQTRLGRPDRVARSSEQATSVFTITGLNTWQANADRLQLFSAGVGAFMPSADNAFGGPLQGSTKLDGLTLLLSSQVDSGKGDLVWLTQLVGKQLVDGTAYVTASKSWSGSFVQAATTSTAVAGGFSDVAQGQTLTLSWKRSQFRARAAAANAAASQCSDELNVAAQPGLAAHGNFSDEPDVLVVTAKDGSDDVTLSALAYGNPYPASWGLVAMAATRCAVDVPSPAGAPKLTLHSVVDAIDSLANMTQAGAAPRVGAISAPTIAGKDALAYQAGVGPTPTFAWQAPSVGHADEIALDIYVIDVSGGSASATWIASVSTGATGAGSLRVPPDVLGVGRRYAAKLTALSNGTGIASGSVSTVLGSFSP